MRVLPSIDARRLSTPGPSLWILIRRGLRKMVGDGGACDRTSMTLGGWVGSTADGISQPTLWRGVEGVEEEVDAM